MFSLPLQLASSAGTASARAHDAHRSRRIRRAGTAVIRLIPFKDPRGIAAPYPHLEARMAAAFRISVTDVGLKGPLKPPSVPVSWRGPLVDREVDAGAAGAPQVEGGGVPLAGECSGRIARVPRAHGDVIDAGGRAARHAGQLHGAAGPGECRIDRRTRDQLAVLAQHDLAVVVLARSGG